MSLFLSTLLPNGSESRGFDITSACGYLLSIPNLGGQSWVQLVNLESDGYVD